MAEMAEMAVGGRRAPVFVCFFDVAAPLERRWPP